jgi:hypothetical protein
LADHFQYGNASGQGSKVVQIVGNNNVVNVTGGETLSLDVYEAGPLRELKQLGVGVGGQGLTATGFVEADILVPFKRSIMMVGRDADLAATDKWLGLPGPVSVRVLIGNGGRGKTRFALQLSELLRAKGWDAGLVDTDRLGRFLAQPTAPIFTWSRPTLVVIDYAAAKAETIRTWLRLLLRHPFWKASQEPPLRLLLLDRRATRGESWWARAFGGDDHEGRAIADMIDTDSPAELKRITTPQERLAIFASAFAKAGGKAADLKAANAMLEQQLPEIDWGGEPLFLMMAGLQAARMGVPQTLALPTGPLAMAAADEELLRVRRAWRASGQRQQDDSFAVHMAAVATLCGGLNRAAAEAAIEREKSSLLRSLIGDAPVLCDVMAAALPGIGDGIAPIQPDILGEAALVRAWRELSSDRGALERAMATHPAQVQDNVSRTLRDFIPYSRDVPADWMRRALAVSSTSTTSNRNVEVLLRDGPSPDRGAL